MTLYDEKERTAALDPGGSFIVQAPAGSGKTGLLTQRFLVLLSRVKQPEEILAMTFTRKAAAGMRARIVTALQQAKEIKTGKSETVPDNSHDRTTFELASAVLEADRQHDWQLLASPERLRIQTIDAFNSMLTRQLPLLSGLGASPDILPHPEKAFGAAVRELINLMEQPQSPVEWSEAIAVLLRHLDNQPARLESLLVSLLQRRDQWLPHVMPTVPAEVLRKTLETQLAAVCQTVLKKLAALFPVALAEEIMQLAAFSAANRPGGNSGILSDRLPGVAVEDRNAWLILHELLFTRDHGWRRRFDKNTGFPPTPEGRLMKQRMQELVAVLSGQDELYQAFCALRHTPEPRYPDSQWETLAALHRILPPALAMLRMVFQQTGQIDYTENALAALTALGEEEAPTDLALVLDYRIHHILVDEFQDTSATQYRLLEKLVSGWQPGDGRTLFLVGDPMQSIYRFREAEVGLFIRACKNGLGPVSLTPLQLSVNFRAVAGMTAWVNEHFPHVLPACDDIATGAVAFRPGKPGNETEEPALPVQLISLPAQSGCQGEKVLAVIRERQTQDPNGSIAILVRSRNHLSDILPALKQAGLSWHAIDIDPLAERSCIQDLLALTRALLDPHDRVALLSVLRAPWCGLLLSDLLVLASNPHKPLWEALSDSNTQAALTPDGQIRLARILPVLASRLHHRERFSLRYQTESAWLLLGGPVCLSEAADLEDSQAFFQLLGEFDQAGNIPDIDELNEAIRDLYAMPSAQSGPCPIQIMTIHNAKGLEFDTVILPHAEKKVLGDIRPLMLWMQSHDSEGTGLLMAPLHATGNTPDSIYEYIRRGHEIRNDHEQGRLLYVAVTRAKKQLAIVFDLPAENRRPANSLLAKLWPALLRPAETAPVAVQRVHSAPETTPLSAPVLLRRLPVTWQNPLQESVLDEQTVFHRGEAGFLLEDTSPRLTGIVLHAILCTLCEQGTGWWNTGDQTVREHWLKQRLLEAGLSSQKIRDAANIICRGIDNTLKDTTGQWILANHPESAAEWSVTALLENRAENLVIDRTFVDGNTRWIIDFKTSRCEPDQLGDFLEKEGLRYRAQLEKYRAALQAFDPALPVRMGLYFPLLPAFLEIPADSPRHARQIPYNIKL